MKTAETLLRQHRRRSAGRADRPAAAAPSGADRRREHHGREQPSARAPQTFFPPTPLPIATGRSSRIRPGKRLAEERGSLGRGLTAPSSNKEPAPARRPLPSPYGRRGAARGGVTAGPTCSPHTHAGGGAPPPLPQTTAWGRGRPPPRYFGSRPRTVGGLGGKRRAAPVLLLGAARLARAAGIIEIRAHAESRPFARRGETVGIPSAHVSYWFRSSSQPATAQLLEQLCLLSACSLLPPPHAGLILLIALYCLHPQQRASPLAQESTLSEHILSRICFGIGDGSSKSQFTSVYSCFSTSRLTSATLWSTGWGRIPLNVKSCRLEWRYAVVEYFPFLLDKDLCSKKLPLRRLFSIVSRQR